MCLQIGKSSHSFSHEEISTVSVLKEWISLYRSSFGRLPALAGLCNQALVWTSSTNHMVTLMLETGHGSTYLHNPYWFCSLLTEDQFVQYVSLFKWIQCRRSLIFLFWKTVSLSMFTFPIVDLFGWLTILHISTFLRLSPNSLPIHTFTCTFRSNILSRLN